MVSGQFLELRFLVIEMCSYVRRAWRCANQFVVELINFDGVMKNDTGFWVKDKK